MRSDLKLLAVAALLTLAACTSDQDDARSNEQEIPRLTAATLGEQTVLEVSEYLAQVQYSRANRKNGAAQAQICKACHTLTEGGQNMIGPDLHGFFGRSVGARDGFDYSPVLRNADFRWTPRTMDAWLAQPGRFLPGNRMMFAGIMESGDRDDLIAYLLDVTSD